MHIFDQLNEIKKDKKEEKEKCDSNLSPFFFISDLSYEKRYVFNENIEHNYIPFITNKNYSFSKETILLANKMNMNLYTKKMHFDFYFSALSKKRRYNKWIKKVKEKIDDISFIKELYLCNEKRAIEHLSILDKRQLTKLKKMSKTKTQ
jgi:hypothetical protein